MERSRRYIDVIDGNRPAFSTPGVGVALASLPIVLAALKT